MIRKQPSSGTGNVAGGHWLNLAGRTAGAIALFIVLCSLGIPPVDALDATPEASRWARRALLNEGVRKHLELRVGEADPLDTAMYARCDVRGEAVHAVLLRRDEITVVTIQRNLECLGHCAFKTSSALALSTQVLAGQTWVFVDETVGTDERTTTHRRLLTLRGNELAVRQSWVQSMTLRLDKRFQRELLSDLRTDNNALLLTTHVTDQLDGEALPDAQSQQVLRLTPQPDGSLRTEVELDKPVAVSVRMRHARNLEREHLLEAALLLAREARDAADKLPGDDARRLDATALVSRFEARLKAESVQISPKR